ncbi:MAG TPA: SAM-dependent methyltransferase [Verrucomicrobiae bacterium]|jgi:extracellular factor (EF) 3-hydroxypalmitic acid methyl ester biosynthesis protein|nr:SAM-dependent methyltransferase [Verrucomicrobiae bacterium]
MNSFSEDCQIVCRNSDGLELHASMAKLTRFAVVFEVYGPGSGLRVSEVLKEFQIILRKRVIYSGRATIRSLVATDQVEVCEASLSESFWLDLELTAAQSMNGALRKEFDGFIQDWQKLYNIVPEYKIIIADMQSFFMDLRLWLNQVELVVRAAPEAEQAETEERVTRELVAPILPCIDVLFEKFETIALSLDENIREAHRSYMRRQLHPLVLCAPFAHRTFEKPLGYAGDYEMVNMIVRDLYEGKSLFAKVLNTWFLRQMPAEAHRNRIKYLRDRLIQETARAARGGRPAKILNLGCGPAFEIQRFLQECPISDNAQFTLLDFNDETLQYTQGRLSTMVRNHSRRTEVQLQKKSVLQVLKEYARPRGEQPKYDMVYCAGLFDYLADPACKHLMNIFYDMTLPGGLVLATNVEPSNPMRNGMEHLLDWNLIYRNGAQFRTLRPQKAEDENVEVYGDVTGVNVILEVRKSAHA